MVSEKQDESVQSMEGIRLKENCKSQNTEAKGTNKSCGSLVMTREVKFHRPHVIVSEIKHDRLRNCKHLVEKAIKLKKIFTIYGPYPVIRASLRNRGWVEKRMPKLPKSPQKKDRLINTEYDLDDGIGDSDGCDSDDKQSDEKDISDDPDNVYSIMSRLLKNETPSLVWTNGIDAQNLNKDQIFNHYVGAGSFTTKAGLCVNLRNFQWFNGVNPDSFFPRCYRIAVEEEKQSFIEDFRMTAARSILKWVVELKKRSDISQKEHDQTKMAPKSAVMKGFQKYSQKKGGVVPIQLVQTALRACEEYLNTVDHKDIDVSLDTPPAVTESCWEETIQQYYEVIHEGATIQNWNNYAVLCENMLQQLQEANTQLKMEGMHNIWIVKPGAQSRGRGITCMNRLEQIVKLVYGQTTLITDGKWVVQKYIEHPLLIYGTKFDVRQWFLVTDWNPVTIWFYKDCYLRFSTQVFSLENLDTAIHLCNNSIQKHFMTSSNRHPSVPRDNMWSSNQFKEYLNEKGFGNTWEDIISPGMKAAIVHTMQIMQDVVKPRKNSFELYGADFLLGEDFKPWLIEINCSPTMSASTPVTAALCSSVQEDTIKVVIDRRNEKTCEIGRFELLYKQCTTSIPLYLGINLLVEGSSIKKPPGLIQRNHSNGMRSISQISETVQKICGITSQNRQTILNDDVNTPADAENVKNTDCSKIFINPSKSKYSLIDRNPKFANNPLIPNNSINAKYSNTSIVKNYFIPINSSNENNPLVPNNSSIAKNPLNPNNCCIAKNSLNSSIVKILLNSSNFSIVKNSLNSNNSSIAKNPLNSNNSSIATNPLNPNNSSIAKNPLNPNNSSTANNLLNPNNSSTANKLLNPNNSTIANNLLNPNNSSITNSSLISNNSSITNNSLIPNKSSSANSSVIPNKSSSANSSVIPNKSSSANSSVIPNKSSSANSSVIPNKSSSANSSLIPNKSSSANSSVIPNNSSITNSSVIPNNSSITNSSVIPNNSSITNSSLISNKSSSANSSLILNNSSNVSNPSIAKNHNIPKDSNHVKNHSSPNNCSKEKTLDIPNNSSKIKISSVSKHFHKPRNHSIYNCKKARNLSSPRILGINAVKAWDEMEEIKNNIAETAQAAVTGNITKLGFGDKVEQHCEVPRLSKTEGNRKTGKQCLPPKSKISQMSMSVKHLILPNRQILRDPLHVKLKYLSLDMLDLKDMQHSRSSTTTDANRVRAIHEKTVPLRYSYNSPRLQLNDLSIPQLHITGLQPQFKPSTDISHKYIETHQTATTSLFNIKKHLLTSSFPLFQ
ncbi:uncharacterized protein [Heptranchias perlo]|uniref:uncharacterized protein n=1 Tax=Heptranchias perlo TaxID=212740 RepID=UPI00355992E1